MPGAADESAPVQSSMALRSISGHVPALDGIRGLAILLVTGYRFNLGPADTHLPGKVLFSALHHGDLGVDLFFVLSGFLITGILYDAKASERYFRDFYARRALRIFPLYYGFLFLMLVVLPYALGSRFDFFPEAMEHQPWLWLYGANFLMGFRDAYCLGAFSHFWSLSIEEHFYLVWPLVVWLCSRRGGMIACVVAIVISLVGRAVWIAGGGGSVAVECFTFFRLDALGLGGLFALAARGPRGIGACVPWALTSGVFFTVGMGAIAVLPDNWFCGTNISIRAGFFGALLVLAVAAQPATVWGWLWRSPVLRFFGKYSYAMYVFQWPLIPLLAPIVTAESLCEQMGSVTAGRLAYLAIMTATTTALAVLSWQLYEKHFLALKARFSSHR